MKTFGKTLLGFGAALFTMLICAAAQAQEASAGVAFGSGSSLG